MRVKISQVWIEIVAGDITSQKDVDAIVNASNAQLVKGGGVAGAIHRAAGPGLEEECRPLAPIRPGQAVITRGHQLPNKYVIHCLGPVYGKDHPEDVLLASCYRQSLELAEKLQISSIAFPAISTGIFGYPMQEAAQITWQTILPFATEAKSIHLIRMVLFDQLTLKIFLDTLS